MLGQCSRAPYICLIPHIVDDMNVEVQKPVCLGTAVLRSRSVLGYHSDHLYMPYLFDMATIKPFRNEWKRALCFPETSPRELQTERNTIEISSEKCSNTKTVTDPASGSQASHTGSENAPQPPISPRDDNSEPFSIFTLCHKVFLFLAASFAALFRSVSPFESGRRSPSCTTWTCCSS
jgi:hypothetical protein